MFRMRFGRARSGFMGPGLRPLVKHHSHLLTVERAQLVSMICQIQQLGRVNYSEALQLQRQSVSLRKEGAISDTLLLLEHPHVYTFGRNARREHLLVSLDRLATMGAQVFETDRGGDITYHGPGQLVGYPILDLT